MEHSNDVTVPTTRNRSPDTSAHCIFVSESPKKKKNAMQSSTAWSNALPAQRRDRARSTSIVDVSCSGLWDLSQQLTQGNPPMCTPLTLSRRTPPPLCGDGHSSEVGQMFQDTHLRQNQRTATEPGTGKAIPTPGISLEEIVQTFHLLARMRSRSNAHSYEAECMRL